MRHGVQMSREKRVQGENQWHQTNSTSSLVKFEKCPLDLGAKTPWRAFRKRAVQK